MKAYRQHLLLLCWWCLVCLSLCFAQTNDATLKITVVDPNGAAIRDARVQITSDALKPKSADTNRTGEARLQRLTPGTYRVIVEAAGFEAQIIDPVTLHAGANTLEVKLNIANVKDELEVKQDRREAATDPRGDGFSSVLNAEQLAMLPDDPDEFEQALRNMAGPGARFRVNGFGGGKLPPKSQIREIRFRTNAFAAENHDFSHIMVDIYTKPGINNWHGSVNFGFRDESLNARNAFAPFRGAEQDRRYGLEFGGPLWRNHTSLFFNLDGMNSFDTNTIVAALPTGNFYDLIRRPARRLNLSTRIEHALGKTHTLRGEYQRNANRRENQGVGNSDLAERAFSTDTTEHIFRLADSGAWGKKMFNEIRFQTTWREIGIASLSNAPTIRVLDAFTSGGQQVTSNNKLREIELTDNLDLTFFKKHTMRVGGTMESGSYRSSELRNQNGTFTFASLADFRANRPLQYTLRRGAPLVDFDQYQFAWYAQDDWRVHKSFTLSFGLRHELQTNLRDKNNFAPRAGFAWSPFRNGKTTIRGGAGIFYDWFGNTTLEQILRVNGQNQNDLIVRNPGYPDPFSSGTATTLPPSVLRQDAALRMPTIVQSTLGVERELPKNFRLTTNYTFTRGLHQLRGLNINQPIPGLGRPFPTQGNITQVASIANSFGHSLMVNAGWNHMPKRIFVSLNYRLSKTTNEADSAFSLPVNSYDLRGERGPAQNDIRHMLFGMASFPLYKMLRVGTTFNYLSAMPYNITTGFDNNGDAVINDRPAGVIRNSARGAGQFNLGTRLSWAFGFGKVKEQAGGQTMQVRIIRSGNDSDGGLGMMPGAGMSLNDKRYKTEFYVQAANLLNNVNRIGFVGVQTSPFFGQAIAAMPGRRLETGMRFSF
ncbi:MAG TPA: carboxypeptidase regulatory-like domain-containing protein [Blastocatellia bacterium]|nr:carboxypeptidase regulatory-like domain-containing protein [Blastocatellia bacterium]